MNPRPRAMRPAPAGTPGATKALRRASPQPGPLGTDCWVFSGAQVDGYGMVKHAGTTMLAHVLTWEDEYGPVPAGLELDHLCRNRACIRPEHLEAVSHRENVLRGAGLTAVNAAKTVCEHGHPLTVENVYRWAKRPTERSCRGCRARRMQEARMARRRAAMAGHPTLF